MGRRVPERSRRVKPCCTLRPGTLDRYIYEQVVEYNEYGLPDRFDPADVVVDVGVHIGAFALAVLERGCRHVHGIEADRENLRIATDNLRRYIDQGEVTLTYGGRVAFRFQ